MVCGLSCWLRFIAVVLAVVLFAFGVGSSPSGGGSTAQAGGATVAEAPKPPANK